jgi:hypothetical protein
MLPSIDTKQYLSIRHRILILRLLRGERGIAYGRSNNSQFAIFLNEPSPTTSLDTGKGAIKGSLEIIQRSVFRCERIFQGPRRLLEGFRGSQIFPEKLLSELVRISRDEPND